MDGHVITNCKDKKLGIFKNVLYFNSLLVAFTQQILNIINIVGIRFWFI